MSLFYFNDLYTEEKFHFLFIIFPKVNLTWECLKGTWSALDGISAYHHKKLELSCCY